jgi:hypothetical protein
VEQLDLGLERGLSRTGREVVSFPREGLEDGGRQGKVAKRVGERGVRVEGGEE